MKTSEFQNLQLVKIDLQRPMLLSKHFVLGLLHIIGLSSSNNNGSRMESFFHFRMQSTNLNQFLINKR